MTTHQVNLLCQVNLINPGEATCFFFTKQIELPFPPFVGLTITLTYNEEGYADDEFNVKTVTWDHVHKRFGLTCETDTQDNRREDLPPDNVNNIIEYYTKLGWTLAETDHGPFIKTTEEGIDLE